MSDFVFTGCLDSLFDELAFDRRAHLIGVDDLVEAQHGRTAGPARPGPVTCAAPLDQSQGGIPTDHDGHEPGLGLGLPYRERQRVGP